MHDKAESEGQDELLQLLTTDNLQLFTRTIQETGLSWKEYLRYRYPRSKLTLSHRVHPKPLDPRESPTLPNERHLQQRPILHVLTQSRNGRYACERSHATSLGVRYLVRAQTCAICSDLGVRSEIPIFLFPRKRDEHGV
jgi:hypothetical protein